VVAAPAVNGGEGGALRPHVLQDRPFRAVQPGLLRVRGQGWP
jgi:hypothetical protein